MLREVPATGELYPNLAVSMTKYELLLSPERWLSSDGCFDRARAQERSLAFGAGPRRCPGSNLAMREAILILAMILRHFDNFKHTSSISSVEMKTTLSFQPANFEVSMSKRQNSEGTFV